MSLPTKISKQNLEVFARAHAQNISGARQHDDKKKSIIKFCCYDQKQQPHFPHIFFVRICYRNKKMLPKCCPTIKEMFWLENFSQKVFLISLVTLITVVGANFRMTYVFASYL